MLCLAAVLALAVIPHWAILPVVLFIFSAPRHNGDDRYQGRLRLGPTARATVSMYVLPRQPKPNASNWPLLAALAAAGLLAVPIVLLVDWRSVIDRFDADETSIASSGEATGSGSPAMLKEVRPLGETSQAMHMTSAAADAMLDAPSNAQPAATDQRALLAATAMEAARPAPRVGPTQPSAGLHRVAAPSAEVIAAASQSVAYSLPPEGRAAPPPQPYQPLAGEHIQAARRQALQCVQRGTALAGRGAYFSARSEFLLGLQTIVEAVDATRGTLSASQALRNGLLALDEAEDLIARDGAVLTERHLEALAASHHTPVLRGEGATRQSPLLVEQAYYQHAQRQLSLAASGELAAVDALQGLGRVHSILSTQAGGGGIEAAAQKSQAYYEAALALQPSHVAVANDLAVLLARQGQLERARDLLQASLMVHQQPHVWRNLAAVHERLGQAQLAALARGESAAMASRAAAAPAPSPREVQQVVHWVDAKAFAQTSEPSADLQPPSAAQPPRPTPAAGAPATPRDAARLDWARLIPWNRWQR